MSLRRRIPVVLLTVIASAAVAGRADGSIVANFNARESLGCQSDSAMADSAGGGCATSQHIVERGVFSPAMPISHGGCQGTGTGVPGGTAPSAVLAGEVQLPESTFSVLWVFEKQVAARSMPSSILRPPRGDLEE